MRASRWDAMVFARAAVIAAVTLAVAWLVTAVSDEGAVAWGARAGRTLPLTPLCSAVGVWGALAQVRARGDVRALAALGRSPTLIAAGAIAGGAVVAFVAAGLMGEAASVDVSGFYPSATQSTAWRWHDGAFEDREQGLGVSRDGSPIRIAPAMLPPPRSKVPPNGRVAAALATAVSALAMAALTARAIVGQGVERCRGPGRRSPSANGHRADAVASGLAAAATVALFQAAAAHRTGAFVGVLPSLALLGLAGYRYRPLASSA
jgi:hypothetical protein